MFKVMITPENREQHGDIVKEFIFWYLLTSISLSTSTPTDKSRTEKCWRTNVLNSNVHHSIPLQKRWKLASFFHHSCTGSEEIHRTTAELFDPGIYAHGTLFHWRADNSRCYWVFCPVWMRFVCCAQCKTARLPDLYIERAAKITSQLRKVLQSQTWFPVDSQCKRNICEAVDRTLPSANKL